MPALLRSIPDAWGPKFDGENGAVTQTRTGPNQIVLNAPANLALVMLTPQPNREVALNSSCKTIGLAPAGALEIVPEGAELFARWTVDKENLLVAIDEKRLAIIAGMEFQNEDSELQPPRIGNVDRKALLFANLMREEFQRGEAMNELCFDGLITLFATHLLRAYPLLFLWGGVFVGIYTTTVAMLGDLYEGSELIGIYALLSVAWGIGAFAGPFLCGIAMEVTLHGLPLFAAIACGAFALFSALIPIKGRMSGRDQASENIS
ncbi:MFS transporter [Rhizobium rhizogenes]|uniref:hypothetical protein n=1 Tax=Rhizobium rhizogenes TaxID=359 RepID=UPI0015734E64|nr:hypothetical protein [Rhizobium rhizogenes]NTF85398.1 MFS transporter [Rhizobium rhizogenes]NTI26646.1 MFS transporter [Rhizobium rhizogenes]NTI31325.1 MFS transporter [Rhizobium rhizogenes]NTI78203.1 MFS transporter [Rhizobium rhizogenes]QTG08654.1 MFS transporter [Rhizobium rhizogenes]